jgi:hypothetical protein
VTYPTLTHVAMEARPYPTHLLEGCETGLVLFAAAFLGHNDAIHFAEAGLRCSCVDVDAERLAVMRGLYPDTWAFFEGDAWEWAEKCRGNVTWDAVSCDTWTGDLMERSLVSLDLWCSLARKAVTVTITDDVKSIDVPEGWWSSLYPRSDHVSWLVLERE